MTLLVDAVVDSKIKDKQLENVDFTFKDISRIKASFIEILMSGYHTREVRDIKDVIKEKQLKTSIEKENV